MKLKLIASLHHVINSNKSQKGSVFSVGKPISYQSVLWSFHFYFDYLLFFWSDQKQTFPFRIMCPDESFENPLKKRRFETFKSLYCRLLSKSVHEQQIGNLMSSISDLFPERVRESRKKCSFHTYWTISCLKTFVVKRMFGPGLRRGISIKYSMSRKETNILEEAIDPWQNYHGTPPMWIWRCLIKAYAPNKSEGKRKFPQTFSYLRKASGFDPGTFEIVPLQSAGVRAIH